MLQRTLQARYECKILHRTILNGDHTRKGQWGLVNYTEIIAVFYHKLTITLTVRMLTLVPLYTQYTNIAHTSKLLINGDKCNWWVVFLSIRLFSVTFEVDVM